MKKILSIITICAIFFGCADQYETSPIDRMRDNRHSSQIRSIDQAIKIATDYLSASTISSRSSAKVNRVTIISSTFSRSTGNDTLLYALDIEDENGFVLIAAPQTVEPIMAVIEEGSFNDPLNNENEAFQETLSKIKDYVSSANDYIRDDTLKLPLLPMYYYDTIDVQILHEPAIKVAWNQRWPENLYAPNKIAGCVPVAIGQLLSALEEPKSISYTYPNHNINTETLNWDDIKKHINSTNYTNCNYCDICSASNSAHYTIGRLIREIGHRSNAKYNDTTKTSVLDNHIESTVFSITSRKPYSKDQDLDYLFRILKDHGGAAIVGFTNINNESAHAFIADGAQYIEYTIRRYDHSQGLEYDSTIIQSSISRLIHYNWGWGGNCNGWFTISSVIPANAEKYDYPDEVNYSSNKYKKDTIRYWHYIL